MKRRAGFILAVLLVAGCASFGKGEGKYATPERAQIVLAGLEAVRHNAAVTVAELYLSGHLAQVKVERFEVIDNRFRAEWDRAAMLVTQWKATGKLPPGTDEALAAVEAAALEIRAVTE